METDPSNPEAQQAWASFCLVTGSLETIPLIGTYILQLGVEADPSNPEAQQAWASFCLVTGSLETIPLILFSAAGGGV